MTHIFNYNYILRTTTIMLQAVVLHTYLTSCEVSVCQLWHHVTLHIWS